MVAPFQGVPRKTAGCKFGFSKLGTMDVGVKQGEVITRATPINK